MESASTSMDSAELLLQLLLSSSSCSVCSDPRPLSLITCLPARRVSTLVTDSPPAFSSSLLHPSLFPSSLTQS